MAERLPRLSDLPGRGTRIHLLGAAGAGMRALAAVLIDGGWHVSGSDRDAEAVESLAGIGLTPVPDSGLPGPGGADLVIRSSAIPESHPALVSARESGIPVLKRAQAVGSLVNGRRLAAVAGTHGKTTVTTMLGLALEAAGKDPLVLVGGHVSEWAGNARVGRGPEAVVEADEYDQSFLQLDPSLAIVTSVEPEHLECYGSETELRTAFQAFAAPAATRVGVLVCEDDAGSRELGQRIGTALSYGFSASADYRVEILGTTAGTRSCRVHGPGLDLPFDLEAPGEHNAQNAAAALVAAVRLGAEPEALSQCLSRFGGVARRLQVLGTRDGVVIVDDYAHHPTEVRASVSALRSAWPEARLVVAFQPHLYSRTQAMGAAFGRELAAADEVLVLPIYPAREEPIAGGDSALVVQGTPKHVRRATVEEAVDLAAEAHGETVIVFMGAGDVTDAAHRAARMLGV
ncbi:MAG: UDP-N-acetylmuramate--L-alanine ligase [Gemmatimonadota bacterium]